MKLWKRVMRGCIWACVFPSALSWSADFSRERICLTLALQASKYYEGMKKLESSSKDVRPMKEKASSLKLYSYQQFKKQSEESEGVEDAQKYANLLRAYAELGIDAYVKDPSRSAVDYERFAYKRCIGESPD